MINLLADDHKREIRAARINVILIRYISMLAVAFLVISSLLVGVFIVLGNVERAAILKTSENNAKVAAFASTKQAADDFRTDLSTAKSILDKEITYSNLIYKIAESLPSGITIDALDLDSTTLGTPITMNANGKSYEDGVRLKNSFENTPELYSGVSLESITSSEGDKSSYPFKIKLKVTINKVAAQ